MKNKTTIPILLLLIPIALFGFDQDYIESSTHLSENSKETLTRLIDCSNPNYSCNEQGYVNKINSEKQQSELFYQYGENREPNLIRTNTPSIIGNFIYYEISLREDLNVEYEQQKFLFFGIGVKQTCNYEFWENNNIKKSTCGYNFNFEEGEEHQIKQSQYNNLGKVTQYTIQQFNSDGNEEKTTNTTISYIYDQNNNLKNSNEKTTINSITENGELNTTVNENTTYTLFNEIQKIDKTTITEETIDEEIQRIVTTTNTTYTYNENNDLRTSEKIESIQNNNRKSYTHLTYQYENNLKTFETEKNYETEKEFTNQQASWIYTYQHTYNSRNQTLLTTIKLYETEEDYETKTVTETTEISFTYNQDGSYSKTTKQYQKDELITNTIETRDQNEFLISTTFERYENGILVESDTR